MTSGITRFPLSWPETMPRTKSRETSRFKTSLPVALAKVAAALLAFGRDSGKPIGDVILSSNVSLGHEDPDDPGVAAWFIWEGQQMCIAVDRYRTPAENLNAIWHVLEARRTELRHGTLALVRATFHGFKALPPPDHWSKILGVDSRASKGEIETAFRIKAMSTHPDHGGSDDRMAELNRARERALRDVAA